MQFVIYNNFLKLMKDFIDYKIDANTYQKYFFKFLQMILNLKTKGKNESKMYKTQ